MCLPSQLMCPSLSFSANGFSSQGLGKLCSSEKAASPDGFIYLSFRPEASNEFYDGDHDNDKESDVEI